MKKILIVISDYYADISKSLLNNAKIELNNYSFKIIKVPGVFEIPITISKNINKYNGFIALGCVIKGKTPHFDFISKSTIDAIMQLSISHKKPSAFRFNLQSRRDRIFKTRKNAWSPNHQWLENVGATGRESVGNLEFIKFK